MNKIKMVLVTVFNFVISVALTLLTFIMVLIENYPAWLAVPIVLLGVIADRLYSISSKKNNTNYSVNVNIETLQANNAEEFFKKVAEHIEISKPKY